MLTLIKIIGRGPNVPEPEHLALTEKAAVKKGVAYALKDGRLIPASDTLSLLPTYVAQRDEQETTAPLVYRITEDMIFSVPLASEAAALTDGEEYLFSADGQRLTSQKREGALRGAILMDKRGAALPGDAVLVRFSRI